MKSGPAQRPGFAGRREIFAIRTAIPYYGAATRYSSAPCGQVWGKGAMKYTQLGTTGLNVSRICFGCWQLSPNYWGDVPLDPWRKAVGRAAELGINFIDTAGAYGDGFAETTLGEYLSENKLRDRFIIATKIYWNFTAKERYPDTSYRFIMRECEEALMRLRTDYIDLFQIHAWDPLTRPDEVAAAMGRLKQQGKVRHVGVSNLNIEQMDLYRTYMDVASLQPLYNLIDRGIERRVLPYCLRHKIAVLPYSALYRGLLTGKYQPTHKFEDDRNNVPLFKGRAFKQMLDGTKKLGKFAKELDITVPQLAIRWVLTQPAVTSAIVGLKTPEQVETIASAADDILPAPIWHKAGKVIKAARQEARKA